MVQRISFKHWQLAGNSVMKKALTAMIMGVNLLTLSSCGEAKNSEDAQTNIMGNPAETGGSAGEVQETQNDNISGSADFDLAELENLTGEYEYLSDYGTGKLIIQKTSNGYDISDYKSESSCRFLADSSNIETIENNRIYLKYPEQVFLNDTAAFSYYILEYSTGEINVYYGKSGFEETQLLYHAAKKSEAAADELLNSFIHGSINAVDSTDLTSTFYITDLNMDSEEWAAYSIGEKADLDNDGENELIISGPYGGIYLDARDNKVYEFAAGDGSALILSYVAYNGTIWIMYSNSMNAGYKSYHMEKFEGADNLVEEMNFSEELVDENNQESGMKYMLNGAEISCDEYTELCSKIFAGQVNTGF